MGLNGALATARQSLDVFSAGIQVAGQNISNASTPGYIREELLLETGISYRSGSLILGTGVVAAGVEQQIDRYLEQRIHLASAEASTATVKNQIFKQLEGELQELGEGDLSTALSDFADSISDLATQPESAGFRDLVVRQGGDLARDIRSLYERVDELRQSKTVQIENVVQEANELIEQIHDLNTKIVKLEYGGLSPSDAGAARSERYTALTRLSEILPIRYQEQPNGTVDVTVESDYLVLSGVTQQLEVVTTGAGPDSFRIELSKTRHDISRSGGELRGLIEGRDDILGGFLGELDRFAEALIFEFNQLHASGEGLAGYSTVLAGNAALDPLAVLNQPASGLAFTPRHGSFDLKVVNQQTGIVETNNIAVDLDGLGADASLEDIRAAIDSVPNLTATITPRGELQIDAAAGYEFRFSNDTSGLLAALGVNAFFAGTSAVDIDISGQLEADSRFLATGQGGGPADGRNVTGFIEFLDEPVADLGNRSLHGFYEEVVTQLAQDSASEDALARGFATFRDSLKSQQLQFTGVSLDEEAIKVLEFQRAYQAAARIVTTVNELFAVLVNL